MVLPYAKLKRNRPKCVALTGVTPKELAGLLPAFARAYAEHYPAERTMAGKPRQRQAGGGRKGGLPEMEQKLLFILVHQKAYPRQTLLGEVFELSQPRVNEWIHRLLPILKEALEDLGVLPEREPEHFARSEARHGERPEFIIDGTGRRRQRPKTPEKQAAAYSGKKKTHWDKNVVIVQTKSKRVGFLSQTYAGKTHDKKIVDTEAIVYPPGTILSKDTGFQGYEPAGVQTQQPKKSPGTVNSRKLRSGRTEKSPASGSESNMPWRG
jgi:DDE superfamily endonuclease/Helix-turn-helix of DDE superfamily endonuclease